MNVVRLVKTASGKINNAEELSKTFRSGTWRKLQNDDYHSTSCLGQELLQSAWTMKHGHLRQHLLDSGGNTASLLMRSTCQVSGIERRLPAISPRIEFCV
jgi:hypothetical protein